ncbi:hypothetical protein Taro_022529 [Colocasia esculenta]|uniref:Uncharacterized protein n=1 Tax=Colocasia esculenta TaxID=4460 RepID=A0A843V1L6_COLES|nr:hypothetical protein [Colocasia esculenta]
MGTWPAVRSSWSGQIATVDSVTMMSRWGTCHIQQTWACCGALSRCILIPSGTRAAFRILVATSRAIALEGLSTRQVVTVSWDPRSSCACVRGGCSGRRDLLESSTLVAVGENDEASQQLPPRRTEETGSQ